MFNLYAYEYGFLKVHSGFKPDADSYFFELFKIIFSKHVCLNFVYIWSNFKVHTSKDVKSVHYRPTSETPSEWRFAGGPIEVRDRMLVRM